MAVAPDVLQANYDKFRRLQYESRQSLAKAVAADESKVSSKRQILTLYRKALRDLGSALSISTTRCSPSKQAEVEQSRETLRKHLQLVQGRCGDLEVELNTPQTAPKQASSTTQQPGSSRTGTANAPAATNVPKEKLLTKDVPAALAQELMSAVLNTAGVRLDDVLGNSAAKSALEESVILPTLNPGLFTGLREPCKGILLFGPPGNGKTMLAKAVASESHCTFFNISAATIMSKWVGEGERLMKALFQMARNAQPSIIFIDEIDSLLCSRQENENGASRRVKTEFLLQFDGCASKSDERILVLGATNRPYELDDGVLRRFSRRIYVDLPDAKARSVLIETIFRKNQTSFKLTASAISDIAKLTDGYSFSDMTALCREAAMAPLRGLSRTDLARITPGSVPPVEYQDLKDATRVIRASSNPENTKKLVEFAKNFAQYG